MLPQCLAFLLSISVSAMAMAAGDELLDLAGMARLSKYIVIGRVSSVDQHIATVEIAAHLKGTAISQWAQFGVVERDCDRIQCLKVGDRGVFFIAAADEGFVGFVKPRSYALFGDLPGDR